MATGEPRRPQRTCVGCGEKTDKDQLLRIVSTTSGRIKLDGSSREPGRGAYVHRRRECVEGAIRKHGLEKSFKRNLVSPSATELWSRIEGISGAGTAIGASIGNEDK